MAGPRSLYLCRKIHHYLNHQSLIFLLMNQYWEGLTSELIITSILLIGLLFSAGCLQNNNSKTTISPESEYMNETPTISLSIPISAISDEDQQQKINLTINRAQKIPMIQGTGPDNGVWLVIDLSINNTGFSDGIRIKKGNFILIDPIDQRNFTPARYHLHISNPWNENIIDLNKEQNGEIFFNTPVSPNSYSLVINDDNGSALARCDVQTVKVREYTPFASEELTTITSIQNLSSLVDQLTTPQKTLDYMRTAFTFETHGTFISYSPEEFLKIKKGDCKDYATFFSYVISRHGYYAEIVDLHYIGKKGGHVVVIFKDDDGQLKYMSSDKLNGFRSVISLDELVQKEETRLGEKLNVTVSPPGTTNVCPYCR